MGAFGFGKRFLSMALKHPRRPVRPLILRKPSGYKKGPGSRPDTFLREEVDKTPASLHLTTP